MKNRDRWLTPTVQEIAKYPEAGKVILNGRYELLHIVGRGGMGLVYKAIDRKDSEVKGDLVYRAIKVLDPILQQQSPQSIKAIKLEAVNAKDLKHNNIITVYDFSEDQGWNYLIMEWLEGSSLREQLPVAVQPKGLALEKVLEILSHLTNALTYAHSKDIIHRDIKPENIIYCNDDSIILVDFGVARLVNDTRSRLSNDNQLENGSTSGSLDYLPPESFIGGHKVTQKDDIYSLAITTYELLSGEVPFKDLLRTNRCKADEAKLVKPCKDLSEEQWEVLKNAFTINEEDREFDTVKEFYQQLLDPNIEETSNNLYGLFIGGILGIGINISIFAFYILFSTSKWSSLNFTEINNYHIQNSPIYLMTGLVWIISIRLWKGWWEKFNLTTIQEISVEYVLMLISIFFMSTIFFKLGIEQWESLILLMNNGFKNFILFSPLFMFLLASCISLLNLWPTEGSWKDLKIKNLIQEAVKVFVPYMVILVALIFIIFLVNDSWKHFNLNALASIAVLTTLFVTLILFIFHLDSYLYLQNDQSDDFIMKYKIKNMLFLEIYLYYLFLSIILLIIFLSSNFLKIPWDKDSLSNLVKLILGGGFIVHSFSVLGVLVSYLLWDRNALKLTIDSSQGDIIE